MKTKTILWSFMLLMTASLLACDSDDNDSNGLEKVHVINVANSGLKSHDTDAQGVIEVEAVANGYFRFVHQNAVFNCEPDEITVKLTTKGKEIVLTEDEVSPKANCLGLYDLSAEVGPVIAGDYELVVKRENNEIARLRFPYGSSTNKQIRLYASANEVVGTVYKDANINAWAIKTVEEGTVDAASAYYPSNLPLQLQKEGLKVRFSGNVYDVEQKAAVGGLTYYGIYLTAILQL